jgi:Ca2+-binding EF-hand superfamily protein
MYDLLIYNPKIQFIDAETLKRIADETGHPLSDLEVQFALNEVGDGKVIPIESFIKFMKSN